MTDTYNLTLLTPAAGKRLIAKAVARHEAVRTAWNDGTLVIVAGTTNGYVAEEILRETGQWESFDRGRFVRGVTLPPHRQAGASGQSADESAFPGDVVIIKGRWMRGQTIFDVADQLREGDVVLKGANAVNLVQRQAAILIGHPKGGTAIAALQAVVGRRVRLILPVGLEKRVSSDLWLLAERMNAPGARGPRLLPVSGEIITELDAVRLLSGAQAELVAAGGVAGAEGAVWLSLRGTEEEWTAAKEWIRGVADEPPFQLT